MNYDIIIDEYDYGYDDKLTHQFVVDYCKNIMEIQECSYFDALVIFLEDHNEKFDEFDIVDVLSESDKKMLKDYLTVRYNIGIIDGSATPIIIF